MTTVHIQHGDVDEWLIVLNKAAEDVLPGAKKIVGKGSFNIKKEAQRLAPRGPHSPHYYRSISYDTHETKTAAMSEIGPDKNRPQGALGNLFEYGSPTSPPQPHMVPAGDAEEPRFVSAMEALAAKLLEQR